MPVMSVIIKSDNVLNDDNHCIIMLPHYSFYLGFSVIQFIIHRFPIILSLIIVHFGILCGVGNFYLLENYFNFS